MKWIAPSYKRKLGTQEWKGVATVWHRWYAWRPTYIAEIKEGEGLCPAHYVWFDYVERRLDTSYFEDPLLFQILASWISFFFPRVIWDFRPNLGGTLDTKEPPSSRVRATSRLDFF